jgi:hypothetical protein
LSIERLAETPVEQFDLENRTNSLEKSDESATTSSQITKRPLSEKSAESEKNIKINNNSVKEDALHYKSSTNKLD